MRTDHASASARSAARAAFLAFCRAVWPPHSWPELHHHPVGWSEGALERFLIRYRPLLRCGVVCGLLPISRHEQGTFPFLGQRVRWELGPPSYTQETGMT